MTAHRERTAKGTFKPNMDRAAARAKGEKLYQGIDCQKGHGGVRFVSNNGCSECLKEHAKKYYFKNHEEQKKRNRDYAKKDPAANAKRSTQWAKANPQYMKMMKHKRRQLVRNTTEQMLTPKEWAIIKREYDNTCLCCGRKEPDIKLEMDHVVSIANGGLHTANNIQPLCRKCNASKGSGCIDYRGLYEQKLG